MSDGRLHSRSRPFLIICARRRAAAPGGISPVNDSADGTLTRPGAERIHCRPRAALGVHDSAGVAQPVEHLTCNQEVAGSSPTASSPKSPLHHHILQTPPEGFPSGQREQTVNLPSNDFGGSNPPPSTSLERVVALPAGVAQLVELQPSKLDVASSSLVARSETPKDRSKPSQ